MSVFLVSKSPVGSSKNKIFGSFANARAIVTLYYSPPDNWFGKCIILCSKPIFFNKLLAFSCISSFDMPP